jgi:calcium binding protein 39
MFKGNKKEKPAALVKHCRQGVQAYIKHSNGGSKQEKAIAEVSNSITGMKVLLYGDGKTEATPEAGEELLTEIFQGDLLGLLFTNMGAIEFEVRQ